MSFSIKPTPFPDVLILEPKVFSDERGFFFESFNKQNFNLQTGLDINFVQDNHSKSVRGVLRGLHYQIQHPQGKLTRVTFGCVYDVVVDLRQSSKDFGKWIGVELSAENQRQLWIPPGFAHGFLVLTEFAEFLYKTTDYWYPKHERTLLWSDPKLGIKWPSVENYIVSAKDAEGLSLREADKFD